MPSLSSIGYLTSSTLIETVKRIGMIPESQSTFTSDDFLAIANQEIRTGIIPSILQYHEEYYVRDSVDITLVAGQIRYPIPYRAIGGRFRNIFYKDTQGNLYPMSRIAPENRPLFQENIADNSFKYFFIEGNDVVIPATTLLSPVGSLVITFFMRPNELVDESRTGIITNISTDTLAGTTTYTLTNFPSALTSFLQDGVTLTGFSTSSKLDIMQTRAGHKTIVYDIIPTAVNSVSKTVTFDTDDIDDGNGSAIVGDYIAFAGECVIPQIPADLHDVLAQRVMMRCVKSLGDTQSYQMEIGKLQEMEKNTGTLVDNRSEGNPQKITNPYGLLRRAKFKTRSWR